MNIPNVLSLFRICLVPVFLLVYFSGGEHASIYAACIYALATFTDYLDGHIARKYNLITNLGKVLDPLGDKLITFSVLFCLAYDHKIPWFFVIILFTKEALMGIGGLIIHKKAKVEIPPSNYIGKTATVLFFVFCAMLMLFDGIPKQIAILMVASALALSFVALISYVSAYTKIMKGAKPRSRSENK